jgi:hypothetical protein
MPRFSVVDKLAKQRPSAMQFPIITSVVGLNRHFVESVRSTYC